MQKRFPKLEAKAVIDVVLKEMHINLKDIPTYVFLINKHKIENFFD